MNFKVVKCLEESLLSRLSTSFVKDNSISDELLESFLQIYHEPIIDAFGLLDKQEKLVKENNLTDMISENKSDMLYLVSELVAENDTNNERNTFSGLKRSIYQVKGSIGLNSYVFKNLSYCSCEYFKLNVLNDAENIYCKHIILVKLALAMKKIQIKKFNQKYILDLIKSA